MSCICTYAHGTGFVASRVPSPELCARDALGFELEASACLAAGVDLGAKPLDDDEPPREDVDAQVHVPDRPLTEGSDLAVGASRHLARLPRPSPQRRPWLQAPAAGPALDVAPRALR